MNFFEWCDRGPELDTMLYVEMTMPAAPFSAPANFVRQDVSGGYNIGLPRQNSQGRAQS
jgi:hypothetical protein